MSVSNSIIAPRGMSYVNAFHALWLAAKKDKALKLMAQAEEEKISTPEKVAAVFARGAYVYTAGARRLEVNFRHYPTLIVKPQYLERFEQALAQYEKVPSHERFDPNDEYAIETMLQAMNTEQSQKVCYSVFNYSGASGGNMAM